MHKALDQFRAALTGRGIIPPEVMEGDGKLRRCDAEGKNGKGDAAYLLHLDGIPAGGFENHRDGIGWESWRADLGRDLSAAERAEHRVKIEAARQERDAEQERRRGGAAMQAWTLLHKAMTATSAHPYLIRKGVKPHGAKIDGGDLLVPLRDANKKLHSLQRIGADGAKRFLTWGRVRGCFYGIGKPDGVLCVVEGFATGASVHEATGYAVAVAFDAGNLLSVAQALRTKYPALRIILCADDDAATEGNPGMTKANEAAAAVSAVVVAPDFGDARPEGATDFNDLHVAQGLDAVRRCIKAAELRQRPEHDAVRLVRGCDLTPQPIAWLWLYWLALGKVHILAGPPGQGKTTIALGLAATVTSGKSWPDGSRCDPGNVLIWSGEDDPADTLLPRLIAAGADPSRAYFVTGSRIGDEVVPFDPARDLVALTAQAQRIGNVRLLIVDPVVSAVAGDSHKNTEVRRALQPLVDLASSLNAAVLGISHFSKGTGGREPTERVTGSVAFGAVARVVMVAAKVKGDDGDRRVLARAKSNIGPDEGGFEYSLEQTETLPGITASRVLWGKSIDGTARELLAEPDDEPQATKSATDDAAKALAQILSNDTVPSRDATKRMKDEGFTDKMIRGARERIGVTVKRSGFGSAMVSYWRLPDGAAVPADSIPALPVAVVPSSAHSESWASMGMNGRDGHEWAGDAALANDAEVL